MRKWVYTTCLVGLALGLVGCGATRPPQVVIAPTYSYVQADLAAGISIGDDAAVSTVPGTPAVLTSVSSKLPPMPAAPGFETLVYVPADLPVD